MDIQDEVETKVDDLEKVRSGDEIVRFSSLTIGGWWWQWWRRCRRCESR